MHTVVILGACKPRSDYLPLLISQVLAALGVVLLAMIAQITVKPYKNSRMNELERWVSKEVPYTGSQLRTYTGSHMVTLPQKDSRLNELERWALGPGGAGAHGGNRSAEIEPCCCTRE